LISSATRVAAKLGQAGVTVAGVLVVTFVVTRVVPGDPAVAYAGPRATEEQLAAVREAQGLDKPLPAQLWDYLTDLFRGDWGTSLHTRQPVLEDLARVVPASLELVLAALLLAVAVGVPAGALAASARVRNRRWRRWPDGLLRVGGALGVSTPVFWLALVLQLLLADRLGWLPVAGRYDQDLDSTSPLVERTGSVVLDAVISGNGPVLGSALVHLALPAVVVAAYPTGAIALVTRASVLEELRGDYVTTLRALGFGERALLTRFVLRPALSPVMALVALVFAVSLVNTFLVEAVFDWPGLGRYAADAVRALDVPAIVGVTLLVAVTYVVVNMLVDVVQAALDPRVRPT
jgi:peptide/nickel transport system permease protein